MKNKHISQYLKYYFELSSPPGYAVMISGEWGCGKTWFVNKLMEDYSKASEKEKTDCFMYISLYGMKDISEIDAVIFQNLHPVLASKPMAIAGSLLRGAAKIGFNLNIDFNGDSADDVKGNVDGNPFLDTLTKMVSSNTDKIMIFDDLERCYIPHQELFGYLNMFVEHQEQKVVLISHEEELFNKDNDDNTKKYKEKIIGATFNVEADVDEAFKTFLKLVNCKHRLLLSKYKKTMFLVYNKVGRNNLRNLRQAIVSFPYFLEQFPDGMIEVLESMDKSFWGYQTENNEFENVIRFYFYLFLEEKSGYIDKKNWEEAASIFHSKKMSYADFLHMNEAEQEEIRKSIRFSLIINDRLFGLGWYDVVVLNRDFSREMNLVFENMKNFEKNKSKAVWIIREGLIDLPKEELKTKYTELLSDIEKIGLRM